MYLLLITKKMIGKLVNGFLRAVVKYVVYYEVAEIELHKAELKAMILGHK